MRGETWSSASREILQQMKAISNLGRLGRALTSALGIGARPIPRNHLHPGCSRSHCATVSAVRSGRSATGWRRSRSTRMVPECAVSAGRNRPPPARWAWERRGRLPVEQAQERVPAHREAPRWLRRPPALPPKAITRSTKRWPAAGCVGPTGGHGGQPFGEDAATTGAIAAEPLCERAAGDARGNPPRADRPECLW